jgi:hypothetical protein
MDPRRACASSELVDDEQFFSIEQYQSKNEEPRYSSPVLHSGRLKPNFLTRYEASRLRRNWFYKQHGEFFDRYDDKMKYLVLSEMFHPEEVKENFRQFIVHEGLHFKRLTLLQSFNYWLEDNKYPVDYHYPGVALYPLPSETCDFTQVSKRLYEMSHHGTGFRFACQFCLLPVAAYNGPLSHHEYKCNPAYKNWWNRLHGLPTVEDQFLFPPSTGNASAMPLTSPSDINELVPLVEFWQPAFEFRQLCLSNRFPEPIYTSCFHDLGHAYISDMFTKGLRGKELLPGVKRKIKGYRCLAANCTGRVIFHDRNKYELIPHTCNLQFKLIPNIFRTLIRQLVHNAFIEGTPRDKVYYDIKKYCLTSAWRQMLTSQNQKQFQAVISSIIHSKYPSQ